jgi:hypothetical protein
MLFSILHLLRGRYLYCGLCWVAAFVFHPLMAAIAALLLILLVTMRSTKRKHYVLTLAVLFIGAILATSLARLPVNADYRSAVLTRSYLFLNQLAWYELAGAVAPLAFQHQSSLKIVIRGPFDYLACFRIERRMTRRAGDSNHGTPVVHSNDDAQGLGGASLHVEPGVQEFPFHKSSSANGCIPVTLDDQIRGELTFQIGNGCGERFQVNRAVERAEHVGQEVFVVERLVIKLFAAGIDHCLCHFYCARCWGKLLSTRVGLEKFACIIWGNPGSKHVVAADHPLFNGSILRSSR